MRLIAPRKSLGFSFIFNSKLESKFHSHEDLSNPAIIVTIREIVDFKTNSNLQIVVGNQWAPPSERTLTSQIVVRTCLFT